MYLYNLRIMGLQWEDTHCRYRIEVGSMLSYEQKSCLVFQVVFNEEQCSLVTHTVDCIQLNSCKSFTIFVFFFILHLYFWYFSVTKFYDQKKMPISLSLSFARKLFLAHRQDLGGHRPWGASCKVENRLWTWASRQHHKTGLQNSRELQGWRFTHESLT